MEKFSSPKEIIELLVNKIGLSDRYKKRFAGTPGEMIEKLSPEFRRTLQNLKSDDLIELTDTTRYAGYIGPFSKYNDYYLNEKIHLSDEKFSKEKMKFDKKLILDLRRVKDKLAQGM